MPTRNAVLVAMASLQCKNRPRRGPPCGPWNLLFGTSGEGEQVAQVVVDAKQLAARPRVMALGGALRQADEQPAEPACRARGEALRKAAQPRGMAAEHLVHQLVLERDDGLVAAGVALPAAAAEKLPVDAPGVVALGSEHVQAADIRDAGAKADVRAPA